MEKKKTSFVQGAAVLGVAGLLVKIIGAVFRIPLNNAVGPIGMSYYEVVYPYYSGLLVISSSGLPTAISKMVSERVTAGDYRGAHKVFVTAMRLLVCLGLFTGLLMFFGSESLSALSSQPEAHLSFKVLSPALLVVSIMCAYRGYLQGMQRMTGTALSQIVEQVGKLAIGLTLAIKLLPKGPEYAAMGALIGVTASEFLALLTIIFVYNRYRPSIRRHIEQSAPYAPAPIAKNLILLAVPITLGASISSLSGMVDSNGVHFLRPQRIDMPYQLRPEVDSRVFLLKLFPGTQPDVLDFIAQAGYRGLVIEAFGLGGLHYIRRNLVEKLRMLRQRGVRILVLTQCMYEKADLSIYEVGTQLLRTDVLSGMDLTTEAAVTKLMWALAQDNTDELLTKNLCGEIRD